MHEFTWTKKESDLKEWDVFLNSTPRGHYLQISYWLKSYEKYGFKYNYLLVKENNKIVAGAGIIISSFSFFKFLIVPCGPVVLQGYDYLIEDVFKRVLQYSKEKKCCYTQINPPVLRDNNSNNDFPFPVLSNDSIFFTGNKGKHFKFITVMDGFKLLNIKKLEFNLEAVNKYITSDARRNIKIAKKHDILFKELKTLNEINDGYHIFEQNAKFKNYNIRDKGDFVPYIQNIINNGNGFLFGAIFKDQIIGVSLLLKAGNRLTYIMGGNIGHQHKVRVGHLIHFEAIKRFIGHKIDGYDFTPGGPKSVVDFKESFNTIHIPFISPRYWVHNKLLFTFYIKLLPFIKKNKKTVSKVIKFFK